jgi:hypothetical protein
MENEKRVEPAGKPCEGLFYADPAEAYRHIKIEKVADYGRSLYGHALYTWDDGCRFLAKCGRCGGYILIQRSEYHSFSDDPDSYYTDFFPVSSPEEADELNRKYSGFAIEREFKERYLTETNGSLGWSE